MLENEVEKKEKARRALKTQATQLKHQKERLMEANTALRVVLKSNAANRREIEEQVSLNINELIFPFDYHRNRIRKKLGLNKEKTNLQAFLQALPGL